MVVQEGEDTSRWAIKEGVLKDAAFELGLKDERSWNEEIQAEGKVQAKVLQQWFEGLGMSIQPGWSSQR